jgi:syndecan 4
MHNAIADVWQGPLCEVTEPVCANDCSSHGACIANGVCTCDVRFIFPSVLSRIASILMRWWWEQEGYSGTDCSVEACPNNCGGNGLCVDGECCCDTWWSGADCTAPVCTYFCSGMSYPSFFLLLFARPHCHRLPTGNGECVAPNVCSCSASDETGYWTGADCDVCQTGFTGADCKSRLCPGDCSSHGDCNYDTGVRTLSPSLTGSVSVVM